MNTDVDSVGSSLRKRKIDRTREAIIDASLELFEQHGFDQVSVKMIMAKLDISTRTFYRYFPFKESVLFSIQLNETSLEDAIRAWRPNESLIRCIIQALVRDFEANDSSRVARIYKLLQATPTLQAKAFKLAWQDSNAVKQALCTALGTPDSEAIIIAHTALDAFRQGIGQWLRIFPGASLQNECDQVLQIMTSALVPASQQ